MARNRSRAVSAVGVRCTRVRRGPSALDLEWSALLFATHA